MHLSHPVAKAAVRSKAVVLLLLTFCLLLLTLWECSMFCCTLLYVHSNIAIILIGKREVIALLNLSSWYLVMVERLFLAVPRGCLQFVIVVFPDHTHYFCAPKNINIFGKYCISFSFFVAVFIWRWGLLFNPRSFVCDL